MACRAYPVTAYMQALGSSKACLNHAGDAKRHPTCFMLASMQRDRPMSMETFCECSNAATMNAGIQAHLTSTRRSAGRISYHAVSL